MVNAVHTAVPGRARFEVETLAGSPALKNFLEARLNRINGIKNASASDLTGKVLLNYDPKLTAEEIGHILEGAVKESKQNQKKAPDVEVLPALSNQEAEAATKMALIAAKLKGVLSHIAPQPQAHWHLIKADQVIADLETSSNQGLSQAKAELLLKKYGPNQLPESQGRSKFDLFFSQLNSLPVALLGGAAALSVVTGGVIDAVVIIGVVMANAVIGYFTESSAEKTIQSLKSYVQPYAPVIREGKVLEVETAHIVPGDILVLKPGVYVAADSRVVKSHHLRIDESSLTGESMPVRKLSRRLTGKTIPLADRRNMVYRGTTVTGGQGLAVVVATSSHTEIGRIQLLLDQTTSPETPIEKQLGIIGDQLVLTCAAVCGVVFLMGFFRGYGILQMLHMSVALAAAAVPEGLPAAATTTLALGVKKMRGEAVLIRNLDAVETLGALQTICMDKTGTITENRMSVVKLHTGSQFFMVRQGAIQNGKGPVKAGDIAEMDLLLKVCVLCTETKINGANGKGPMELIGSATENALVQLALDAGMDAKGLRRNHPLLKTNHRSENRLYMSTMHKAPDTERFLAFKGSPPEVLELCATQMSHGEIIPLTENDRMSIEAENERMAGAALRVLGVAYAEGALAEEAVDRAGLTWLGLVGMADPVRPGVERVIEAFHRAGVNTVMITGDQSPTAYSVARDLDLSGEKPLEILDSAELTSLDDETLRALASKVNVYSRVSPAHKLKIVQSMQSGEQVVAMTGDGINDGPALKAADVGIAMGSSGTDVAREVADIVLEQDDLETLMVAVREGRTTFNNIKKSVHFFLATNLSEIMLMFGAMAAGIGFPLNTMQLLYINLISDIFPGLALSLEEPEEDVMERPPREPGTPLFEKKDYTRMVKESSVITGASLGAYAYGIMRYGLSPQTTSLAFHTLTISQLIHAYNCRAEHQGLADQKDMPINKHLNWAVGGSLALQVLTMFLPGVRSFLGLTRPGFTDLAVIGVSSVASLLANDIIKDKGDGAKK
jgi:Ca2+-transporting ATPase